MVPTKSKEICICQRNSRWVDLKSAPRCMYPAASTYQQSTSFQRLQASLALLLRFMLWPPRPHVKVKCFGRKGHSAPHTGGQGMERDSCSGAGGSSRRGGGVAAAWTRAARASPGVIGGTGESWPATVRQSSASSARWPSSWDRSVLRCISSGVTL